MLLEFLDFTQFPKNPIMKWGRLVSLFETFQYFRSSFYPFRMESKLLFLFFCVIQSCAPKKPGGLGGTGSSGTSTTTSSAETVDAELVISYTQSTVAVTGSSTINNGSTTKVCATFKNASGVSLAKPDESMTFSLTGAGTSSGTFSSPTYDSGLKRWCSTFTATTDGTAKEVMATHLLNGNPQSLTSTLPSITVNPLSPIEVTMNIQGVRAAESPFDVDITFSRSVTSFGLGGIISYSGGSGTATLSEITPGLQYRVNIDPDNSDDVTLTFGGGEVADSLGYINSAASFIARRVNPYFNQGNGTWWQGPNINFDGVCTSQAGDIYVQLSGSPSSGVCTNNAWSGSGTFSLGSNSASVWQFDGDNNNISSTITFYSDIDPPSASFSDNNTNFSDDTKAAYTFSGNCTDDLYIDNISVTLTDSANTSYGPFTTTCTNATNGTFIGTADLSSMTTQGQILASFTISDVSGRSFSQNNIPAGTYIPSGSISNLTSDYTCIGDYCPGGDINGATYSGNCSSAVIGQVSWSIIDGSNNVLNGNANGTQTCNAGNFSQSMNETDLIFTSISDGTYTFVARQCSDNSNTTGCSEQTRSLSLNRTNDCSTGPQYQSPATADIVPDTCNTSVYTYEDYTCDSGSGTTTISGPYTACNCIGSGGSTSYSNFNGNYAYQTCAAERYDSYYNMVQFGDYCTANYNNTNSTETYGCRATLGGSSQCLADGCIEPGSITNISEVIGPNGTCVGFGCNGSFGTYLSFQASCNQNSNSTVQEILTNNDNSNVIWNHDTACVSGTVGPLSHYSNGNFNLPDGGYYYTLKQCIDYGMSESGCSSQSYYFEANNAGN